MSRIRQREIMVNAVFSPLIMWTFFVACIALFHSLCASPVLGWAEALVLNVFSGQRMTGCSQPLVTFSRAFWSWSAPDFS
jgi:hypothetical protein